jgi:hypothetical protein
MKKKNKTAVQHMSSDDTVKNFREIITKLSQKPLLKLNFFCALITSVLHIMRIKASNIWIKQKILVQVLKTKQQNFTPNFNVVCLFPLYVDGHTWHTVML